MNIRSLFNSPTLGFVAALLTPTAAASQQQCPALGATMPLKYAGGATVPAITPCDLMTRLYIFADDSMAGREVGTEAHLRATAYLDREVRRLGLKPAGDSGTYFQNIPVVMRALDTTSTISVGSSTFRAPAEFIGRTDGKQHQLTGVPTVFIGAILDTLTVLPDAQTKGKVLVFTPPPPTIDVAAIEGKPGFQRWYQMYLGAAARVIVAGPTLPPPVAMQALEPSPAFANSDSPIELVAIEPVVQAMFDAPIRSLALGTVGKPVTTAVRFFDHALPGRNVVAILEGSDPKLKGEYVAIGAHNDHIGVEAAAVDHDSLKAFNMIARPQGADGEQDKMPSPDEWKRINGIVDSLHKAHGGPRPDSIDNGADDDGSGSVSVLEIAEAFAKGAIKPKRSILFIWHAGEEKGLWGSEYFTDHPTVPRDSIVAELNMDMVGRGQPADVTGTTKDGALIHGAPNYLQVIGSRRLSTELGDLVEGVNTDNKLGITFDYALDADGHPQNIYCRSDHAEYARYGIPIAFFTTGGHADYHQVTDEPQYIQYRHMAVVDELVFDLAVKVAGLDHRVLVDKAKPDPHGACQQ